MEERVLQSTEHQHQLAQKLEAAIEEGAPGISQLLGHRLGTQETVPDLALTLELPGGSTNSRAQKPAAQSQEPKCHVHEQSMSPLGI